MCGLALPTDANLLVGLEHADDAGVYQLTDDIALIQTVDFFTPIVDDPYAFGQIAAANALSDVYAMGGVPKTAMNLVAFPLKLMELSVLRQILEGGISKMREAGVVLVGGHSIEDAELKYGLAVTGLIHPQRILTKGGLQTGDHLILTKPLGTGIINTAIKGGLAPAALITLVTELMAALNRRAAEIMAGFNVHACTDITGFGLLGHAAEMVLAASRRMRLWSSHIPVIPEAVEFAGMGLVPAGAYKNKTFRAPMVRCDAAVGPVMLDVLFDPQTSGGLLISLTPVEAQNLLRELHQGGISAAAIIGEVMDGLDDRDAVGLEVV